VTQAVEATGERRVRIVIPHRHETGPAVPIRGVRCVDVAAQGVVSRKAVVHVLQGVDIVDHGVGGSGDSEAGSGAGKGDLDAGVQAVISAPAAAIGCQDKPRAVAAGGDVGVDGDVALRGEAQGVVGAPGDGVVDEDIAVAVGGSLSCRIDGDIRRSQVAGQGGAGDISPRGRDGVVVGVDQPSAGLAAGSGGGNPGAVGYLDMGGGGFDEAAVAAVGGAGIEGAGDVDAAVLTIAQQFDGAVMVFQRAGFDHPVVVHRRLQQGIRGLRRHQHGAAVGADQLLVLRQCVERALVDLDADQLVSDEIQRHLVAGGERHGAKLGLEQAFVADLPAQQGDVAAVPCRDGALVDDAAAAAGETEAPGEEVGIAQIERGSHQAADVDLGAGAEQEAVGVEEENLAVGVKASVNGAGVAAQDAVEGNGAAAGLIEIDGLARGDVEVLPVDGEFGAGLGNRQRVAALAYAAAPGADLSTVGQCQGHGGKGQRQG